MSRLSPTEQALCDLLREACFEVPFEDRPGLDWQELLREAESQTVVGLIPPRTEEWKKKAAGNLAQSIRVLHAERELVMLLETHDIPMVILKGTSAAVYYPEPINRSMGDIDFVVPRERFADAAALLEEHGYRLLKPLLSTGSRHAAYMKNGVEFELHHHFSYDELDIEDFIRDGLERPEPVSIGDVTFPMLPPLANGLVLLAHLRSHLRGGLGLRQVLDWMMYVHRVLDDAFWETEFRPAAESRGLVTLAETVTGMCRLYLGLPEQIIWCRNADPALCERLMSSLFSSGNFGRKKGVGIRFETVSTLMRKKGLFTYLQDAGEVNWPAYQRHPSLKPFCWAYQICRLTRLTLRSNRGLQAVRDIEQGRERYDLLKELGIE